MAIPDILWVKKYARYLLGLALVGGCSYALDRSFAAGLTASKWIGLPQYEQAMHELRRQSERWETAALALGTLEFVLVLPRLPHKNKTEIRDQSLVASQEGNVWLTYLGQCILCGAVVLALAFLLAVIMPLAAGLLWRTFGHP